MSLGIYGTGGHAKSVYDLIKNIKKLYFFDEKKNFFKVGSKLFDVEGGIKKILSNKKKLRK